MKIARLIGILSVLLQQPQATAASLAERFEVSRRTIYRDIEALCQAGIPVVASPGSGGGLAIMSGYKIDRALLTTADMQAILIGLRSLDSCSGGNRYRQLMAKLAPEGLELLPADQHILINLASWDKAALSAKIELLHRGVAEARLAEFAYCAPGGETQRQIEPYKLLFQWAGWYVWGWCGLRQDFRLFRLSRMLNLRLGEAFAPRPAPLPDLAAEKVFPAVFQVRALIRPEYKWRLLDEFGPECIAGEQPDGCLLFQFGFTDEEGIIGWIISFGGGAELLEPAWLRPKLAAFGAAIARQYPEC